MVRGASSGIVLRDIRSMFRVALPLDKHSLSVSPVKRERRVMLESLPMAWQGRSACRIMRESLVGFVSDVTDVVCTRFSPMIYAHIAWRDVSRCHLLIDHDNVPASGVTLGPG